MGGHESGPFPPCPQFRTACTDLRTVAQVITPARRQAMHPPRPSSDLRTFAPSRCHEATHRRFEMPSGNRSHPFPVCPSSASPPSFTPPGGLGAGPAVAGAQHPHRPTVSSLAAGRCGRADGREPLQPASELPQAGFRRRTRTVNWRDASQIGAATSSEVSQGLLSQPVQMPRFQILLHLQIPFASIESLEPSPELRPLLRGQLLNCSFNGLHSAHAQRLNPQKRNQCSRFRRALNSVQSVQNRGQLRQRCPWLGRGGLLRGRRGSGGWRSARVRLL